MTNEHSGVNISVDPDEALERDFPALSERVEAMVGRGVSRDAAFMVAALLEVADALVLGGECDHVGEDEDEIGGEP